MHFLLLTSALLAGCLLAVQAAANLQLNRAVGTPYGAAPLQLAVAATLLALLALAVGAIGAVRLLPGVPVWHLLGGLASPLYITSGILLFPRLGALAAVGLFVTGQMLASLGLDLFGALDIPRKPVSIGIVLGALAVLAGITVIIRSQTAPPPAVAATLTGAATPARATSKASTTAVRTVTAAPAPAPAKRGGGLAQSGWIVLGIVAGAVLPVQGAVNARLRDDIQEPMAVGMISFIVATLAGLAVLLLLRALDRTPRPQFRPLAGMPWWGWLGGACAAAYVTATFMLIPAIGAATTVALTVTGQQAASAAIDHRGLLRLPRRPLTAPRLGGLALLIAGSALVQLT
ncbi:transporter family-2 protein [Thermocatellispora tengchongensis]|uniref:Transporter family-2 protein n=1 Tax=Thermocatellispora tengchongensis TaxID=1073253 RepID=A0A840NTN0_9ACTN|nr:DMT family transporter [Thermocatellispora tengchongensis]MBB5130612.1 transporter family-2 protein [Thermocatellispora tengchongensis]